MSRTAITVNAAFLEEIKDVHRELWDGLAALRTACDRPLVCRQSGGELVELLGRLRDQLALQFSLEEAFGYFEGAVGVAPHLSEAAVQLRDEHRTLYQAICRVVEAGEAFRPRSEPALLVAHITPRFIKFDRQLQQHEHRENELIVQAYDQDLGDAD